MNKLKQIIREVVESALMEVWYDRYHDSETPINSRSRRYYSMGKNPLTVDNGNHPTNDITALPSTEDYNGSQFVSSEEIGLKPGQFMIYKIKNFGSDKVKGTLSLFGESASGEKELRKAIDIINGAASRNGKYVIYRTLTSVDSNIHKKSDVANTFWEFSLNDGNTWYILKPNPIQKMQQSKYIKPTA